MKRSFIYTLFFLFTVMNLQAQQKGNDNYNIIWTTQSKNSSESMPCVGGDIGMNVWVEKGELLIYVARSASLDENNALLKSGRLRLKLSPNPFDGNVFKQQLHLQQGYVTIEGENKGIKATVRVWADVYRPVVHIDISSNKNIHAEAGYESWRYQDRVLKSRENFGNSWKWAAPKKNIAKKDSISFSGKNVLFWHRNAARTIFDFAVEQQEMGSVKDQLYNPLKDLTIGGIFSGKGFSPAGNYEGVYVDTDFKGWKLKSNTSSKTHTLQLYLHTSQPAALADWQQQLDSLKVAADAANKTAFAKTQQWWQQFWERSFILIDKNKLNTKSWEIGRNYQLFRYMLACNATGNWPTKFNGGLLTYDPVFTDTAHHLTPDYRNWGGGIHTAQNQRLVYFPAIKNGDWDILQPQLEFYLRLRKNAELRSKVYWGHGGACFTEQMDSYGFPNYAEYGQNRPANFDKGLEYNAWLEYEWDTVFEFCLMMLEEQAYTGRDISDRIPFIESCLQFFDEHYQYLARQRGRQALDGYGKLVLYPGSGAESFKMATNATSTVAAMQVLTQRLLQLPLSYSNEEKRKKWDSLLKRIPPISLGSFNGHTTIAPAKMWERINNTESPQLYPVFPWGIYGVGKPGLDIALNTWKYDTSVIRFRSYLGWKQDNIWAARLGLSNDAWQLTSAKLQNAPRRFPAFWGPGFDWVPDHNQGGSGAIGLQDMLMQTDSNRILLFPAWPKEMDVHFRLHAPGNTIVEAELKDGKVVLLKVIPQERQKDIQTILK